MDICGRDDLFFGSSLDFGRKIGHLRFFSSSPDAQLHLCVFNDLQYWKWVIWLCRIAKWVAE